MSEFRVLLIEDSAADAELAKVRLRGVAEVEHCTSLSAALARLTDATRALPSVVLLDLSLPDSHGVATLERIAEVGPPPLVVLSGEDDPACARAALEHGAHAFVDKAKTSADQLVRVVRDAAISRAFPVSRRSPRLLLVEDSRADAVLTQRALEVGGEPFEITVAGSLREGLDRLAQGFDAILLDLTLPDSVGPETVARMRSAARELPIVVLSGLEDADTADRCIRAGADGYEQKGQMGPVELRRILGRAMERGRALSAATSPRRGVVDFGSVLSQLGNDRAALREIVAAYVAETRENLERLPATIASGAWPDVQRLAHTIKGAMRTFSAQEAQQLALSLEQLAQMDDRSAAAELYLRMKTAVESVVEVLARFSETGVMDPGAAR